MAGYREFSMSNNAVLAYQSGEKPISKWTKKDILESIENIIIEEKINIIKALTVQQLKTFLIYSSWHHTSSRYNKTKFYSIDFDKINNMSIDELKNIQTIKIEKITTHPEMKRISYLVWGRSRNHPKATEYTEECEIIGNWAYTSNGKKLITSNGFKFI